MWSLQNSFGPDASFLHDVFEVRGMSLNTRIEIGNAHRCCVRAADCEEVPDIGRYYDPLKLIMRFSMISCGTFVGTNIPTQLDAFMSAAPSPRSVFHSGLKLDRFEVVTARHTNPFGLDNRLHPIPGRTTAPGRPPARNRPLTAVSSPQCWQVTYSPPTPRLRMLKSVMGRIGSSERAIVRHSIDQQRQWLLERHGPPADGLSDRKVNRALTNL